MGADILEKTIRQIFLEKTARQCAPVIFRLKPSNLLIIDRKYAKELKALMESTGLCVRCFDNSSDRLIWFLYREEDLQACLSDPENLHFMETYGYHADMSMVQMLARLRRRFLCYRRDGGEFPHEMGIFLGYPLGDVKGYIANKGQNCLFSGYWVVYENEQEARETFRLYRKAQKIALAMVEHGVGFERIRQYRVAG